MLKKLLLSIVLVTSVFAQHNASINLNSDDIEVKGNVDLGELNRSDYPNTYFLTLGFLDVDNAVDTDAMLSAGFKLRQDVKGVNGLRLGIGIDGIYTKVSGSTFTATPLGVEVAYTLPINFAMPIVVSGSIDYAPSILSFRDADRYLQKRIEISVAVIEQGSIFVGYRKIDTDFDTAVGDYVFNDAGYIGFKVKF